MIFVQPVHINYDDYTMVSSQVCIFKYENILKNLFEILRKKRKNYKLYKFVTVINPSNDLNLLIY